MRTVLFILGAFLQLLGIGLIAGPDLVPGALRAAGWVRRRWRLLANHLHRLLGLRPRTIVYMDAAAGSITLAGQGGLRASGVVGTSAEELGEQVAYLLRRDRDSQLRVNSLIERTSDLEAAVERRLKELQDELRRHVAVSLTAAQADYRWARVGGAVALAMGLAFTTWASLL